jgi:RNA polymerase sigma-70 factor (ECF subfamily)
MMPTPIPVQPNRSLVVLASNPSMPAKIHPDRAPMVTVEEESDEELARRVAYDNNAMDVLYSRYERPIEWYCRNRLSNREDIEDAKQNVFTNVYFALCEPDASIRTFRNWIRTIAHNQVNNTYRCRRPETSIGEDDYLIDPGQSPESFAMDDDQRSWLHRKIERLPKSERDVIMLRLAGFTNPEISELLGKTYSWVASNQHRALKHLKKDIDDEQQKGGNT